MPQLHKEASRYPSSGSYRTVVSCTHQWGGELDQSMPLAVKFHSGFLPFSSGNQTCVQMPTTKQTRRVIATHQIGRGAFLTEYAVSQTNQNPALDGLERDYGIKIKGGVLYGQKTKHLSQRATEH